MFRLVYIAFIVFTPLVSSHPDGAPEEACRTMTPDGPHRPNLRYGKHHEVLMTTTPCVSLTVSANTFTINGPPLLVTFGYPDGVLFNGFLIRAYDNTGEPVGRMHVATDRNMTEYTQLRCNENGITHTNNDTKTSIQFYWHPPQEEQPLTTSMHFRARFVVSLHDWYPEIHYHDLYKSAASALKESCVLLTLMSSMVIVVTSHVY